MAPGIVYPPSSSERTPMCACADNEANWRGRGLTARFTCACGGTTVSAKGLTWAPRVPPAVTPASRDDDDGVGARWRAGHPELAAEMDADEGGRVDG